MSSNTIRAGQRLRIPKSGEPIEEETTTYVVQQGDTLTSIANRYGVSVVKLKRLNRLTSNALKAGDRLEIPESDAPKAPPAPATAASPRTTVHSVVSGDTLTSIERFGTTVAKLRSANGLRSSRLSIGQRLVIPASASKVASASELRRYRVRSGDTLTSIAAAHNVSIADLMSFNGLTTSRLNVGQSLRIP